MYRTTPTKLATTQFMPEPDDRDYSDSINCTVCEAPTKTILQNYDFVWKDGDIICKNAITK